MLYYTGFKVFRIERTEDGFSAELGNGKKVVNRSLYFVKTVLRAYEKVSRGQK